MSTFDTVLPFILEREGGYANHPNDPGGATMKGITQRVYDAYRKRRGWPTKAVRDISDYEVKQIYYQQYWVPGKCDAIAETHPDIALVHMDCCVNCGIVQAAKLLQRAIGGLVVDGMIGPKTMAALRASDEATLVVMYLDVRAEFYRGLSISKPSLQVFLKGWLARLRHVAVATNTPVPDSVATPGQPVRA